MQNTKEFLLSHEVRKADCHTYKSGFKGLKPFIKAHLHSTCEQKLQAPQPNISPCLACIAMNSTFYEVLKPKKVIKFKKYFDQHCNVACFETLL